MVGDCYLIEEVSDQDHVKIILARRFLNFVNAIRTSTKHALRSLLEVVEYDTLVSNREKSEKHPPAD